jgi:hypothetical protein
MKELKCARREKSKGVNLSQWHLYPPILDSGSCPAKIFFLEERTQTLPVIIEDLKKNEPKTNPKKLTFDPLKPIQTQSVNL